jgi:MFS family permease
MPYACAATAIQLVIPNRARAQITAVYVTFTTLVGLFFSSVVVGLITDRVFSNPADIRYSLAIVVALAAPVMLVLLLLACRPYRDLRRRS